MKLGDKIKKIRLEKNMSQKYLAEQLSIPRSTLANYESNNREPNLELITKIASVLEVSPLDFIDIDENTEKPTNNENDDIKLMLNTLDINLAIFIMLNKFKCFEKLNISFLSRKDYIFLSQLIANNIVSTIETLKNKNKQELIDKFKNFTLSDDENIQVDKKIDDAELLEKNNKLKNEIKELENNLKNSKSNILFKLFKNHLNKKTKHENIQHEELITENEELEELIKLMRENEELINGNKETKNEIKSLEKEIKDILSNKSNE